MCVHLGRIERGQEVIRVKRHQYVHTDDIGPLFKTLARWASAAADAIAGMAPAMAELATRFSEAMRPIVDDWTQRLAADLVDILWELPVSVRPDPDRPGSVLVVAGDNGDVGPMLATVMARDFLERRGIPCSYEDAGTRVTLAGWLSIERTPA